MKLHIKRNNCRLCAGDKLQLVVELKSVPVGEHYFSTKEEVIEKRFPIDIYQCLSCWGVQTLDDIDSKFLWDGYTYFSGQTKGILKHFDETSDFIISNYSLPLESYVFDIGSNDGSLLRCFQNRGFNVYGIDPSDVVADVANNSGIPTYLGLFSKEIVDNFPIKYQSADLITAFNVFAHSPNMEGMIKGVKKMLKPEGIFCFEVQYLGDISNKKLIGTIFHEHMIHYSLKSAKEFLELYDMKMIDYSRNSIQMGSIIFYASHKNSMHKINSIKIIDLEKEEKLNGICSLDWSYKFSEYISDQKLRINDLLNKWSKQKLTIYGYGAARSGPTLAIQFGLEKCIKKIFDDHTSKTGKFGVFESIEILPTKKLSEIKPDIVIILAWIHSATIVKNNLEYLSSGGKFVVLWPIISEISIDNVDEWLLYLENNK